MPSTNQECTCPQGKKECYAQDPTSCNKFYICIKGQKHSKKCPAGLAWSVLKSQCEWPDKAMCGSRPITERPATAPIVGEDGNVIYSEPCSCPSGSNNGECLITDNGSCNRYKVIADKNCIPCHDAFPKYFLQNAIICNF